MIIKLIYIAFHSTVKGMIKELYKINKNNNKRTFAFIFTKRTSSCFCSDVIKIPDAPPRKAPEEIAITFSTAGTLAFMWTVRHAFFLMMMTKIVVIIIIII